MKLTILPHVQETRHKLELSPALILFNFFKGQCTEELFKFLQDKNILYVLVTANTTDKLQPLDLSVNKPAKDFMISRVVRKYYLSTTGSWQAGRSGYESSQYCKYMHQKFFFKMSGLSILKGRLLQCQASMTITPPTTCQSP